MLLFFYTIIMELLFLIPIILRAVLAFLIVLTLWKIFKKADIPWRKALIPIYNIYLLFKIAGKKRLFGYLLLASILINFTRPLRENYAEFIDPIIGLCSLIISILLHLALAKRFGKSRGFGLGLSFLGIIFYPILAFGSAIYQALPEKQNIKKSEPSASNPPTSTL